MDSFELGVMSGMEKTASLDKEAWNPLTAFKGWRASRAAAAPVAKAMGVPAGPVRKALSSGTMSKEQLSAISEAQKSGLISTGQAQAAGKMHSTGAKAGREAAQKADIAKKFQGPKPFSEHFKGMKPVAYTAAVGVPLASVASGAMSADQPMQQQY